MEYSYNKSSTTIPNREYTQVGGNDRHPLNGWRYSLNLYGNIKQFIEERIWHNELYGRYCESFALVYQDGHFLDQENADFVAAELARGHSFFVYISDTVDSLSSCCFSKDTKVLIKSNNKVKLSAFKDIYENVGSDSLYIFHNGSWVEGKTIKLPNRKMYKITTVNGKEIVVSDNHLNPTTRGDIKTEELTVEDYLLFNTLKLNNEGNKDSWDSGFLVGSILSGKVNSPSDWIDENNNLDSSCLLESSDFRQGILDGWSGKLSKGVTKSKELIDIIESLITSLGLVSELTKEEVNGEITYTITWYDPKYLFGIKTNTYKIIDDKLFFKIDSIEEVDYTDNIYCFEMKNQDEPYFTLPNGIITHNCRLKNMVTTKEFNFTNGNMGVN